MDKKITISICSHNEIWLKKVEAMAKRSVDQALLKAKSHAKKGDIEEAKKLYQSVLQTFPKNKRAQQGLSALNKPTQPAATQSPPQEIINQLLNLYNSGNLEAVVKQASSLTEQYPDAFIIWNILGAANKGLGKTVEASEAFKKATELNPTYADGHSNLGVTLQEQGKLEEAIEAYTKALELNPNYAEAYYNMGVTLKNQGKLDEAIEAYNKALSLKPDHAKAYNNMGNALQEQGKLDEAMASFNKALAIKSDYAEAYNNMGTVLKDQGKLEKAIASYNKALSLKPDYAKAYNNMGVTLQEQGKLDEAIEAYKMALAIKSEYAEAYNNMGTVLKDQGKLDEAIEAYKMALAIEPDYTDAHNNMGNVLKDQGKLDEAIEAYKMALAIEPDYAEAYNNMGVTLKEQGKLEKAITSYNKALSLKPDYAEAYYNMGNAYNLKGEIQKGLELFEYRFKKQKVPTRAPREKLHWNGSEPIKGKEFLVYEEQGLGDIIQFCRYLPTLVKQGAKVTFKVTQKLHAILQTMDSGVTLSTTDADEGQIDFEAPLMSLPHLFKTHLKTIPSMNPYLYANHGRTKTWGERLHTDRFKIGICWQGSKSKIDIGRSFPLSLFEGISKAPNVELISLHKGEGEHQIKDISFDLTTLGADFDADQDAFLDTAAVMMNCDLIITSDTAIAHLAGALGCQTWVALKHVPDWRWMLDRSDSPWYPTMTLYRQKNPGDWACVFEAINRNLRILID